jgi:hypothetical protein
LIDGDLIGEADTDLATDPIVQEKYTSGDFADEFDKDAQVDVFEINGHQIRLGYGALTGHSKGQEPC